ncbi:hypothetical protein GX586_01570 [bacterium]|nr:hypothetical protein [bacterium]
MNSYLLYGSADEPNQRLDLRAGPLAMVFEPGTTFLRHIKLGDVEVVRCIYAAVRDATWATVIPHLSNLTCEQARNSFKLSFDVSCTRSSGSGKDDIDFTWHGVITGDASGTVRFEFDGEAHTTFKRKRIGVCVLHPIATCAGKPCTVEHPGGASERTAFPSHIAPHQPLCNIRAISYQVGEHAIASVRFEGDVFETEDQRNWTDASFKTYCTPLDLPTPVEVKAGTRIRQSVTLRVSGALPAPPAAKHAACVFVKADAPAEPLPALGTCLPAELPLSPRACQRLRTTARPAHLRTDLAFDNDTWRERLAAAVDASKAIGSPLLLALHLPKACDKLLKALSDELSKAGVKSITCLALSTQGPVTPPGLAHRVRAALASAVTSLRIGIGTDEYFVELNRNRPALDDADVVAYSLNPQVHTFDNASMVENCEGQTWTALTARTFCANVPLMASPVTLKPRHKAHPSPAELGCALDGVPPTADQRQASLFAAGFTLKTIAALACAGIEQITLHEAAGWLGIMESGAPTWLGAFCPEAGEGVFPVYHAIADVQECAGASVIATHISEPLAMAGLMLNTKGRTRICAANLTAQPLCVIMPGVAKPVRVRLLDERSLVDALGRPEEYRRNAWQTLKPDTAGLQMTLGPCAYACIDI